MNLVRLGHYHVPTGLDDSGYCQTALVVGVPGDGFVNLRVWDADGDDRKQLGVVVSEPAPDLATFHLSGDCPWQR